MKVHFDIDARTEWIYRGSTRLRPLFNEIAFAKERQHTGTLTRGRGFGAASMRQVIGLYSLCSFFECIFFPYYLIIQLGASCIQYLECIKKCEYHTYRYLRHVSEVVFFTVRCTVIPRFA